MELSFFVFLIHDFSRALFQEKQLREMVSSGCIKQSVSSRKSQEIELKCPRKALGFPKHSKGRG